MAIPDNRASTTNLTGAFLPPRDEVVPLSESRELGGIGLNDPSQGLQVQVWTAKVSVDQTQITIEAANHPPSVLYTGTQITEVDLAFDQNMRPFLAFVEVGQAKYRWFDTVTQQQVVSLLDPADLTPRCTLDDKRDSQLNASDILLFYVRGGNVYYRQQRDRYTLERPFVGAGIDPGRVTALDRVGMNTVNRIQLGVLQ